MTTLLYDKTNIAVLIFNREESELVSFQTYSAFERNNNFVTISVTTNLSQCFVNVKNNIVWFTSHLALLQSHNATVMCTLKLYIHCPAAIMLNKNIEVF